MKITIKQETHTEIVDGKAISDQSTTTLIETDDKELNENNDTSNRDFLTEEFWTKLFGGRA